MNRGPKLLLSVAATSLALLVGCGEASSKRPCTPPARAAAPPQPDTEEVRQRTILFDDLTKDYDDWAQSKAACVDTADCLWEGRCSHDPEQGCVALTYSDCYWGQECGRHKLCTPRGGKCVALGEGFCSEDDCTVVGPHDAHWPMHQLMRGVLFGIEGYTDEWTIAAGPEPRAGHPGKNIFDCRWSEACSKLGACVLQDGRCVARTSMCRPWTLRCTACPEAGACVVKDDGCACVAEP